MKCNSARQGAPRRWWQRPIREDDITWLAGSAYRQARRIVIFVIGMTIVVFGVAAIPLPVLPGWILIFVGLAVLAVEFAWARRWLRKLKRTASNGANYLKKTVTGSAETPNDHSKAA